MPATVRRVRNRNPEEQLTKLRKEYERIWEDATDYFIQQATEYVAKDTATLMRGIPLAIRPEDLAGAIRNSFSQDESAGYLTTKIHLKVPYAAYIEYGTDPHPVSKAGVKRLRKWAKRHGLPAKVGDAIAWKIRHHGSEPMPFVRPALRDTIGYVESRLRDRPVAMPASKGGPGALFDMLARISVFGTSILGRGARIIKRVLRAGR